MRALQNSELCLIGGGAKESKQDYNFEYIVSSATGGTIFGLFIPDFAQALGLTTIITNPALATGAFFGGYAAIRLGAQALDTYFYS